MFLGAYPAISLSDARAQRLECERLKALKVDPKAHREALARDNKGSLEKSAIFFQISYKHRYLVRKIDLGLADYLSKTLSKGFVS